MSILTPNRRAPKPRARGHGHGPRPSGTLAAVLIGVLIVWTLVEAGSWFITRIQLEDDATLAAVVAANEVDGLPTTGDTARTALDAAQRVLTEDAGGGGIDPVTLRLFQDGTVRFTAHRAAPSPLLGHLELTKDIMHVHVEVEGHPTD